METMSNESSAASKSSSTAPLPPDDAEYSVVDLGKYVRLLWNRRILLLICGVIGANLGFGIALLVHPAYDATVRLMPPTHRESSLLASLTPARNEGDVYLGLICSRTVADDVIQNQHLADYFHMTRPSELRRRLAGMAKINVDKDQFITVTVRSNEPETSVRIANAFPEALSRLNRDLAKSQAEHHWEYYQGPLEQEKNKLAEAEDQLKQAQQKTGIVLPEAQAQLGLSTISNLKQQITSREEQLAALVPSSTEQNPQVIQLKSQIASLSGQLHRLEAQNGGAGAATSTAALPELTLEVERRAREVKYHETLFEILSRQYENARIDDPYSASVELVDKAVLPDEKSWPPRRLFTLLGLLAGGFAGLVLVFFRR